ncbi:MAG TPA: glycosyltransferase, partial [Pirellulales bacterium]|nr:glycosyltransferase [Pirellulales bacterium]
HGIDAWNIEKHSIRRALANADRIVAVSQYTANRIAIEQGIAPDRISILPNTCDPNVYRPGPKPGYLFQRYGLPPNARVIMTVARLDASERYKGYDQVIRALPTVLQHVPEAHYLLVGRGSDRARIERLIEHEGVSGRVTLAGFVSDDELPDHYRLCDVFVMPSRNEGFGIVYLEAMACGKPVVAGNRDGSVDPLCGGELGVLVDPDDVGEIAEATIEILRGTHPLAVLRQPDELRQRTIDRFGPQAFAEQLQAIWTEHFPNSRSHPLVSKTVDQSH